MPSWRPGRSVAPERSKSVGRGRPRSRRLALAAAAGVAQVGTVVGVAAADVTAAPQSAHRSTHRPTQRAGEPQRQARSQRPVHRLAHRPVHAAQVARVAALRTSCRSVAHIGDSTSVDLISPAFVPNPAQRLQARYADVGVRHLRIDASGGRSIVEALPGQVNGYNVAAAWRNSHFRGCWIIALGTNDTANIAAGSAVGATARIDEMMSLAHGQPVMWVNTATTLTSGPWANANEQAWDNALVGASHRYPNMRIFNWSAVAQPGWFLPDGIHYNSLGVVMR